MVLIREYRIQGYDNYHKTLIKSNNLYISKKISSKNNHGPTGNKSSKLNSTGKIRLAGIPWGEIFHYANQAYILN